MPLSWRKLADVDCWWHLILWTIFLFSFKCKENKFSLIKGEWCQTINIRKTRPLLKSGLLNLSLLQELPHVTYLSNIHKGNNLIPLTSVYCSSSLASHTLVTFIKVMLSKIAANSKNNIAYFQRTIWTLSDLAWAETVDPFSARADDSASETTTNKSNRKFRVFFMD